MMHWPFTNTGFPSRTLMVLSLVVTAFVLTACGAPAMAPAELALREEAPLSGLSHDDHGQWPESQWWHIFKDPQLDALIDQAMSAAPSLDSARARFITASRQLEGRQAETRARLEGSARVTRSYSDSDLEYPALGLPGVDSTGSANRQRSNAGLATLSWSWDLDWWGKKRAAIEAALNQQHAARLEQAATASALQTGIARAYMDWQVRQAQLASLDTLLDQARDSVRITKLRVARDIENPTRLDQARAQTAQLIQQKAQLEGAARRDQAQLAALMGVSMGQLDKLEPRTLPQLDTALPANAGLELVARRPDIMARRWQVEAAMRGIDQARAAYYPNVSLSMLAGFLRVHPLGSGLNEDLSVASLGPAVTLPIFEGGRLDAQYEGQRAALESAIADYNQQVIDAAHQVAEQTVMLRQLAEERQAHEAETDTYRHRLALARERDARGVEDPRTLIEAQQALLREHIEDLTLQGQLLDARLQLIHALGGGYHGRTLSPDERYMTTTTEDNDGR